MRPQLIENLYLGVKYSGNNQIRMGLLDDELPPGDSSLRVCPECGEDKIYREGSSLRRSIKYHCDSCGSESSKSEVQKSFIATAKAVKVEVDEQENVTEANLRQMKLTPKLAEDEEILFVQSYSQNSMTDNCVLAVTNSNLYTRPKKGTEVNSTLSGLDQNSGGNMTNEEITRDILLEDIQALRQDDSMVTSKIEIETESQVVSLPSIPKKKVNKITQHIVEQTSLTIPDWKKEEPEENHTAENSALIGVAGIGVSLGILGTAFGLMIALIGVAMSLTIVGAIVGIPVMIFGAVIMYLSMFTGILGTGALTGLNSGDSEWTRP